MEGSKAYGKWYAQAVMTGVVDTNALATIMQRNCTVKKADILAVITELIETMQDQLQDSKRVKLDGFGSFKIGIENEKGGALTAADFSTNKNVKGLHVLFLPEVKTDSTGMRQKTFITGCSVQEAPKNLVDTTKPKDGESSGSDSGTSTGDNGSQQGDSGNSSSQQGDSGGNSSITPGEGD
jgi:predicted histone-like DNA-binding protein